jgi:hypothetical protein
LYFSISLFTKLNKSFPQNLHDKKKLNTKK